jgi:hypothetical protein
MIWASCQPLYLPWQLLSCAPCPAATTATQASETASRPGLVPPTAITADGMRFSGLLSIRGLHAAAGRRVRELAFCRDEGRAAGLAASTAGAITIAIATPPHRAAMRARMAAYCNPAGTRARGDLVVLDADEMLRLFLIGSHPTRAAST